MRNGLVSLLLVVSVGASSVGAQTMVWPSAPASGPVSYPPPSYVPPSGMYGPYFPPPARPIVSAPQPVLTTPAPLPNASSTAPAIPNQQPGVELPAPRPLDDTKVKPQPLPPERTGSPDPQHHFDFGPGLPLMHEPDDVPSFAPSHENHPPNIAPRGYRLYGFSDFWFLWTKKQQVPPLLSTAALSAPGSRIVLGDLSFDNQERWAARGVAGSWLNSCQTLGLEVGGFWMAERSPDYRTSDLQLARPFLTPANTQAAIVLGAPGERAGAVRVEPLQRLWGGEVNGRFELGRGTYYHFDLLAGFRYVELDESLQITDRTTIGVEGGGTSIVTSDRFGTRNQFYGGQLGAELELHWGRFFVDLSGKLALGPNYEVVNIGGTTVVTRSGGTESAFPGGVLAQPTNIGRHSRNEFVAIPEFNIIFGLQLTTHLRATIGYSLLYINEVARPGEHIDPVLGEARPRFEFRDSDFWAQGVTFGLEFRY